MWPAKNGYLNATWNYWNFFLHSYFSKTLSQCFLHAAAKFHICTSRAGQAGGGSFKRGNNYKPKKDFAYRMCARRPTSAMPKPSFLCERAFSRSMVVMWPVLMSWGWLQGDMKKCGWLWGDVGWGSVIGCEMSCHVIWCDDVISCRLMWCDFLCCVRWRDAMWCHVMCSHVMSWHLLWRCCEVMRWLMSLWCHVAGCDVTLCGSKWLCDVVIWYMTWSSVLQNTSSISQCYKVLASTTPVLFCTTTYYSNTSTTPLLFRTTQYNKY